MASVFWPSSALTCSGFSSSILEVDPSRMFHTGIQYCPVDSIATSVTRQACSHARNRFKLRVNVRNSCFLILTSVLPTGGNTVTVNLSLWTSIPQQRRFPGFIVPTSAALVKDALTDDT